MKSMTIEFNKFKFFKGIILGLMIGGIVLTALLGITAAALTAAGIPDNMAIEIILTAICSVSAYTSGFICSKFLGVRGILNGAVSGLLFFLMIFCMGIIANDGAVTLFTVIKLSACLLFGTVGGIIGINKKEKLIK